VAPAPIRDIGAELEAVLEVQRTRTDAEIKRAQADDELSVFRYADVMGEAFSPQNLSFATPFFKGRGDGWRPGGESHQGAFQPAGIWHRASAHFLVRMSDVIEARCALSRSSRATIAFACSGEKSSDRRNPLNQSSDMKVYSCFNAGTVI
jgi:hypothetical protein